MEWLMAATADSAPRKSSTATSLFSFFLSVNQIFARGLNRLSKQNTRKLSLILQNEGCMNHVGPALQKADKFHGLKQICLRNILLKFNALYYNKCVWARLTILKKPTNLSQSVRREIFDVLEMAILGIISTNCNDFVIFFTLFKEQSVWGFPIPNEYRNKFSRKLSGMLNTKVRVQFRSFPGQSWAWGQSLLLEGSCLEEQAPAFITHKRNH